jgi:hypothetical protein
MTKDLVDMVEILKNNLAIDTSICLIKKMFI